jgi:hypothetical protein
MKSRAAMTKATAEIGLFKKMDKLPSDIMRD